MIRLLTISLLLLLNVSLQGCDVQLGVEQARESYAEQQDFASLQVLHGQLSKGMPRSEVEALLGQPTRSSVDGVFYYLSKQKGENDPRATQGLVVEYIDSEGINTDQLQSMWLGEVRDGDS